MPDRLVIISDTHLGRSHCAATDAEALRPLWAEATHLIVNGDVAEIHHPDHWSRAARQALKLFDLCDADGVNLTLLSGNHDPYITDVRYLQLAGGQVFLTHGDVLHPAVAPWSPAAGRMRKAYDQAVSSLEPNRRVDLETRLSVAQHASHAEWTDMEREAYRSTVWRMLIRPWALAKVLWYWRIVPFLAAEFVREHAPEATFMIVGHTHRQGIWRVMNRVVINTGSFGFPGRPQAVILDGRTLSVWPIRYRSNQYMFAPRPVARYALQPWHDGDVAADTSPSAEKTRPGSGRLSAARI